MKMMDLVINFSNCYDVMTIHWGLEIDVGLHIAGMPTLVGGGKMSGGHLVRQQTGGT